MSISVEQLSTLTEAAATVIEETDLTTVLQRAVSMAATMTGARYAALGIIGDHGGLIEFEHEGMDPETVQKIGHLPEGHGVLGTVIRDARTLVLDHIAQHPDAVGFPEHHPPMETFLGVPVRVAGQVFGNLYLTNKAGGFTDDDARLVEAVAAIAASAVSNVGLHRRLQQLALVDERERIARDVHDSVIQNLFAIGLTMQGLALRVGPGFEAQINELVDRIDGSIDELRRLIFGLRHYPLADVGASLSRMLDDLGRPEAVHLDVRPAVNDLDPVRLDDLVTMIREATANALRHAQASRIEIALETVDRHLVATISDDGIGFDPDQLNSALERSGMGVANLRSRALRLNGHVAIISRPGAGTTVEIVIPSGVHQFESQPVDP
ncbi:MAG TPA: GAF domain-containing sensor histidine kinase [Acidimicrobiia bacterium]|nr:GAF domain-containing sensor histidine kinase [Acidimicrobiia bacterium]